MTEDGVGRRVAVILLLGLIILHLSLQPLTLHLDQINVS